MRQRKLEELGHGPNLNLRDKIWEHGLIDGLILTDRLGSNFKTGERNKSGQKQLENAERDHLEALPNSEKRKIVNVRL